MTPEVNVYRIKKSYFITFSNSNFCQGFMDWHELFLETGAWVVWGLGCGPIIDMDWVSPALCSFLYIWCDKVPPQARKQIDSLSPGRHKTIWKRRNGKDAREEERGHRNRKHQVLCLIIVQMIYLISHILHIISWTQSQNVLIQCMQD